ncbi:type IV pilus assembly protein FimV [Janthinobacterium sp. RB2R34]|uniref:type IV pilus assembly protein FimV n=1 Tax=Janthinobacterium sp. RB2R34 TaxID=3424193 RepID=UPI003F29B065
MPSIVFSRWTAILCATACLAMPLAFAAELGEISVQSHVGQPLSADIELTALAPDELQGLSVRLASNNVYEGGGIAMDAALQTLAISQVERDGRRFVRLSTRQSINAGHVHVYLMLGNGSRSIVRLATVWLTPAPPAPVPVPAPFLAPAPRVMPQSPVPVVVPKPIAVPDAAALAARARAEGMLRPSAVFVAPPVAPKPAFVPVSPPPLRRAAAPAAACAPQAAGVPAAACVALDRQNTALNEKIGVLEGKVSVLQQALAAPAAAAPAPAASVSPHVKAKAAAAERKAGGNGMLWLGLGIVLFLLATALVVYILRKRRGRPLAVTRPPSKYWVLLRKPFRRKTTPVVPPGDTVPEREEPALAPEPFSR